MNDSAHKLDKPYLDVAPKPVLVKTRPSEPPPPADPGLPPIPTPPGYSGDPLAAAAVVGFAYGLSLEELQGKGRSRQLAEARMVAYWVLRVVLRLSWSETGVIMMKDHSCAMSGVKTCERRRASEPEFAVFLDKLRVAVEARLASGRKLG